MSEESGKALNKAVGPLIQPILVSLIISGLGAFSVFQVMAYRVEQAERKIVANEVRFEEFTKEARDADKQILENVARQLDEIKRSLYRIEGRNGGN